MAQISVLLPFRNAAETLPDCLASIAGQSLDDYELLAINDHSSDGSCEIVAAHASRDNRIRLIQNEDPGLVPALNLGLAKARSKLVARMDADDLMHPARLEKQYRHMQDNPRITLLGCSARLFPHELISDGYHEYMRWQNSCNSREQIERDIYVESPFAHPTVVFRTEAVRQLGGYRHGPFPEDYELWLRLFRHGHHMEKLPDVLLDWRDEPNRTSRVDERYLREAFDNLRAEYLACDPRIVKSRHNFVIWGAGRKTRKRCQHLLDKGFEPKAWIDIDPRKIGNRLKGVPVFSPKWLQEREVHPLVLVYVANHGARDLIAADLESYGYRNGENFLLIG
jgi:glycosyltransferase involved in cell wall biosynthesis